jgi:RHS repeat-associated protein
MLLCHSHLRGSAVPGTVAVGSGGASDCTSCGGAGGGNGFNLQVGIGPSLGIGTVGWLKLKARDDNPLLCSPLMLQLEADSRTNSGVVSLTGDEGVLRQVIAPLCFVDVSSIDEFAFRISVLKPAAKGFETNELYQVVGATTNTIADVIVEDPDRSTNGLSRLRISEVRSGSTNRVWLGEWQGTNGYWRVTHPDGHIEESGTVFDVGTGLTTELVRLKTAANVVQHEQVRVLTNNPWGDVLVTNTIGTGTALKRTKTTYYTTTNVVVFSPSGTQQPVCDVVRPDGTWSRIGAYDTNGRPLIVYSGFNGVAVPTTNAATCRTVDYDYAPLTALGDNGSLMLTKPRRETVCINGVAVARTYYVYNTNESRVIRCVSPSGGPTNTGNLVTITTYYTGGDWSGKEKTFEQPDGTMSFYSYVATATNRTTTVSVGEPTGNKTNVYNGTQTVTVTGNVGQTISRVVKSIVNGTVGVTLASETYSNFDEYGRPLRVTYLDGTYEDTSYGCCGVESKSDRDGVVTEYLYDSLKRQVATRRLGVTTTNVLDTAGRVVQTLRIGTNGASIFLGGYAYSTAGDLLAATNAFGGVTIYTNSFNGNGLQVQTTTYPDGGTRIETHCADGNLASLTGTAANPVRYEYGTESTSYNGSSYTWQYTKEIKLDAGGSDTSEWVKTYTDALGRNAKTVYADGAAEYSYYNTKGQLIRSVDADGVATLYQYNGQGEVEYTAVDVDQDATIDFNGLDRVTQTVRDVTTISSVNVRRTRTYQLATDNSSTPLLVNESRVSTDGLQSWNIAFGLTTQSVTTVNTGTGARTTTVTNPDGSTTVSVYSFGRLQTVTRKNSGGTQIAKSTYAYDPHGRVASVTDARNGATVYTYGAGDAVATVTTPAPGTGAPAQTTTSLYDTLGRAWKTVLADGTSTTNEFFLTGQLKKTYGSRGYPVEYTYDPAGRMKTLKTWQNFTGNSGTAVTTWNYHPTRGWLLSKDYANAVTGAAGSTGPDYTYTAGSRLKTRTWAREYSAGNRIVTTYKYGFDDATGGNSHGDLTEVSYNDTVTATVGYGYDRRGRQTTVTQGGNTTTRYYLDAGLSLGESYSGGTLGGLNVTNTFDSFLRRSTVSSRNGTTSLGSSTYGYDQASRLSSVSDGTYSADYVYQSNSSLVDTITFKTSGSTRLTTQKRYDRLNRLQSIVSTPSAANQALPSFTYQYNDANQRTRVALGDGSYWVYDYDSLGQVKAGKRYWNEGTPVAGQQFEYGFDDIGNRTNSKRGGDENGANLRETTYARNYLNQYAGRTNLVGRYADVLGLATFNQSSPASVIVNGQAAYRRSEYWRSELSLGGSNASWQSVTVNVGTTTNTGSLFVSPTPEAYAYDLDGNLTADGRWTYTWDAENRLTQMESLTNNPSGSKRKLTFEYDANGRRIGKKVYVWNGSAYPGSPNTTLRFLYDGWNLIGELDGSNAVVRSYQWGTDLSGSLQGAGGVGGLLSVKPTSGAAQFVVCDGNGNVMALVDGSSGALSASYEYGPFGELIRASGTQAASPFRFSSKYQDAETELLYYGYRYYNSSTGRWLTRDPIGERAELCLYGFVSNNPLNTYDTLGLFEWRLILLAILADAGVTIDATKLPTWANDRIIAFRGGPENFMNETEEELGAKGPLARDLFQKSRALNRTPITLNGSESERHDRLREAFLQSPHYKQRKQFILRRLSEGTSHKGFINVDFQNADEDDLGHAIGGAQLHYNYTDGSNGEPNAVEFRIKDNYDYHNKGHMWDRLERLGFLEEYKIDVLVEIVPCPKAKYSK